MLTIGCSLLLVSSPNWAMMIPAYGPLPSIGGSILDVRLRRLTFRPCADMMQIRCTSGAMAPRLNTNAVFCINVRTIVSTVIIGLTWQPGKRYVVNAVWTHRTGSATLRHDHIFQADYSWLWHLNVHHQGCLYGLLSRRDQTFPPSVAYIVYAPAIYAVDEVGT
jgi:hypothetical protein